MTQQENFFTLILTFVKRRLPAMTKIATWGPGETSAVPFAISHMISSSGRCVSLSPGKSVIYQIGTQYERRKRRRKRRRRKRRRRRKLIRGRRWAEERIYE